MNRRLLDILVCPSCKGPLKLDETMQALLCKGERLSYPIRDGIPVLLASEASELEPTSES